MIDGWPLQKAQVWRFMRPFPYGIFLVGTLFSLTMCFYFKSFDGMRLCFVLRVYMKSKVTSTLGNANICFSVLFCINVGKKIPRVKTIVSSSTQENHSIVNSKFFCTKSNHFWFCGCLPHQWVLFAVVSNIQVRTLYPVYCRQSRESESTSVSISSVTVILVTKIREWIAV